MNDPKDLACRHALDINSQAQIQSRGIDESPVVLLVEDEIVLRLLVAENLRDLGFAVIEAANGAAAIAILRSQPVDFVFTDIKMPGRMDGIGLADWIGRHLPQIPVLLTSGSVSELPSGMRRQDRRLIRKPYALAEVASWIKTMLGPIDSH
jgi:CheY-like chemotaxis protein